MKISLLSRSLVFTRIISCIGTGEEMYSLSSESENFVGILKIIPILKIKCLRLLGS